MFRTGDILSIFHEAYRHYMIVVDNGYVVHASKEKMMVVKEPLREVCVNKKIINHGRKSNLSNILIIQRAMSEVGKPYDLISFNCEHLVRKISGLPEESPQIRNVAIFLVGIAIGFYISRIAQSRTR